MQVGDVVRVKTTGQRARILEERGGYFSIEYVSDANTDPMHREVGPSSDLAGMYREQDLEPATD